MSLATDFFFSSRPDDDDDDDDDADGGDNQRGKEAGYLIDALGFVSGSGVRICRHRQIHVASQSLAGGCPFPADKTVED